MLWVLLQTQMHSTLEPDVLKKKPPQKKPTKAENVINNSIT